MQNIKLLSADLTLFEGGAAATGTAGATTGESTSTSPAAVGRSKGALANVVYGKQESAPGTDGTEANNTGDADQTQEPTQEDRVKAYKDLINGEYKDIHTAETQKIFDKRFKDYKTLQQQVADQQSVLERMYQRYGIEDNNIKGLAEAIDNDDSYWEQAADEAGMTVDQYRQFNALQRQNAELVRQEAEREQQFQSQQQVNKWMQEAETVKAQYPGFDLGAELANDSFQRMLKSGVPMADAFRAMHFNELQQMTAQYAAAQTEKAVTDNIRAKGSRPLENGTSAQSGFVYKTDVTKLNKADREEIARRARNGEMISF